MTNNYISIRSIQIFYFLNILKILIPKKIHKIQINPLKSNPTFGKSTNIEPSVNPIILKNV